MSLAANAPPPSFHSLASHSGIQVVGTYTEGRRLESCAQQSLLVVEIGPLVLTTGVAELARGQKTSRLSLSHVCCTEALVLESLKNSCCGGVVARSRVKSRFGGGGVGGRYFGVVREVAGIRNVRVMVI